VIEDLVELLGVLKHVVEQVAKDAIQELEACFNGDLRLQLNQHEHHLDSLFPNDLLCLVYGSRHFNNTRADLVCQGSC